MLTAEEAQEHIKHTLGGATPSDELSMMDLVNQAGRHLCRMHPWRWLERRFAELDSEKNVGGIRLPQDVQSILAVRHQAGYYQEMKVVGLDYVHQLRLINALSPSASEYPWYGALAHQAARVPNLVAYSDAFDQSPWATSDGTIDTVANVAVDPFTDLTTAMSLADGDATAVSTQTQAIKPMLLTDATYYVASIVMRPDPVTTTTPPKAGFMVHTESPSSGGLQSLGEIQWGTTPWQDAPTFTLIGATTGGATARTPIPVGEGYYEFTVSGYLHQLDENYGRLLVSIQPGRALFSASSGTTDATVTTGKVDVSRVWCHEGYLPRDYVKTGATVTVPRRREPVLEVVPIPTTTAVGELGLIYRGEWGDAETDQDELTLPDGGWLDVLYIQVLRAFTKGWEEEGEGTIEPRLLSVEKGPICMAAKESDGQLNNNYGQRRGTAMQLSRIGRRWHGNHLVGGITAGPTLP